MPGRTVMSPHRRHAITLRRFKVFIAQIKQNQVTRVREVALADYNLLIKTKRNSNFFAEQKTKLILQLAYRTLMVTSGILDAGFLQQGMGLFQSQVFMADYLLVNAGSCSTFGWQII